MEVHFLGTGSPVPEPQGCGTALVVVVEDQPLLFDCGPGTVSRLVSAGIHPAEVERVFLSHLHMDHTAGLFHLLMAGWTVGRRSLTLYGPDGIEEFLTSFRDLWDEDIEYRESIGIPREGIENIRLSEVQGGQVFEQAHLSVTAAQVEHTAEDYAYRIDDEDEDVSVVFSGDTTRSRALEDLAADADLLVHESTVGPVAEEIPEAPVTYPEYARPLSKPSMDELAATHSNQTDAAVVASGADVDALALVHLLPYRDIPEIREEVSARFDGRVLFPKSGDTEILQ